MAWRCLARPGMAWRGAARQGKARQPLKDSQMSVSVKANRHTDIIRRKVTLCGTKDIMFDRYAGDNSTKLEPHQKFYLQPAATLPIIGIPAANITSFLSAHNTNSAPKRLRDPRKYKAIANACLSFIDIEEQFIPLIRDDTPIQYGAFDGDVDAQSGAYIHRSVARLDKGIPNPKIRPVVPLPWAVSFTLIFYPNKEIQEQEVLNLFEDGGRAIGLGTFRGVFGKFRVHEWS